MPPIDVTNPRVIKFLNESYEKEARIRYSWNKKNEERIQNATKLNREFKNMYDHDVIHNTIIAGMAATARDHITGGRHKVTKMSRDGKYIPGVKDLVKGRSIVDIGLGSPEDDPRLARPDTSPDPDPIMRPVDKKLTSVIYHPQTDGNGRREYLKVREKTSPEKKFYFAECVNWDYGWRMKDSQLKQVTLNGRRYILTDFSRDNRVGAHIPDPPYYKSADPPTVAKCV